MGFSAVQRREQRCDVARIRFLRSSEARLVHAVIDEIVVPLFGFINLLAEGFWIQVYLPKVLRE